MSTTSATKFWDGPFAKRFAIALCLVPGLLLIWDALRHQLGVNDVNYAIRSTGLLGIVCLTISLAITPLRRITGWNVLLGMRRNFGVFGFIYILMHFTIFFWWDREGSVSSTLSEIVERVYLWFGTGALVLMIPLTVTSTDGMVTRLGSKRWKLLHRLTYVVVICGLVHYWLLVKSDTTRPFAFTVAVSIFIVFRIVRHYLDLRAEVKMAKAKATTKTPPAKKKFWQGEMRLVRIFQETHDVKTFRFVPKDGGPLPFDYTAGQYLNLALAIDGKRVNRSYTMSSSPTRVPYVEISVKRAESGNGGSKFVHDTFKEGDLIKISAPAGKFFFAGHETDRVLLLAGGVGITPAISVIRSLTDRGWQGQMYLAFAVRKVDDVVYKEELAHLEKRYPNLHVRIVISSEEGHITKDILEKLVPDLAKIPRVMMCGPGPMMHAMRELLVKQVGLANDIVTEEEFTSTPIASAPAMDVPEEVRADPDAGFDVHFSKSDKKAEQAKLTVLEAAEECGVPIAYECRSGICGQCKTKLVSGKVTMEVQDALTAADKAKGLVLACQARPAHHVVIDA